MRKLLLVNRKGFCYLGYTVIGVVILSCSLFLIDFYTLDGASLEAGKQKGEPIIEALENYYRDQGIYPTGLAFLVPKYMNSVPNPAWRYQFKYGTCSANQNYILWFRRSNDVDTYCGYVSSKVDWICADSIPPKCETNEIYNISINPSGDLLALSASNGIRVYSLMDGKTVYTLEGEVSYQFQGIYSYIAWSPNGKYLAIGKPNIGVRIWNVSTWEMVGDINGKGYSSYELPGFAWSPDSNKLALGLGKQEILIWNENDNKWESKTNCPLPQVSLTWGPDGRLWLFSYDGLYDFETCSHIENTNIGADTGYTYAVWSPDKTHIYIFFDLGGNVTGIEKYEDKYLTCCYSEVAWSQDGRYFAATPERSNEVSIWDTQTEQVVFDEIQGDVIYALAWSPGGELFALGAMDKHIILWNTVTRQVIMEIDR